MSPHVFEIDKPTEPHYKMPINAISSIASRVTGCVLSGSTFQPAAAADDASHVPAVTRVRVALRLLPCLAVGRLCHSIH